MTFKRIKKTQSLLLFMALCMYLILHNIAQSLVILLYAIQRQDFKYEIDQIFTVRKSLENLALFIFQTFLHQISLTYQTPHTYTPPVTNVQKSLI